MKIRQLIPSNIFYKSKNKKKKTSYKNKVTAKDTNCITAHSKHTDISNNSRENSISNLVDIDSDLDTLFQTLRSRANRVHATQQTSDTDIDVVCERIRQFNNFETDNDLSESEVVNEGIGQFNSLKPRTRIRTNPWIQLPVVGVSSELCITQSELEHTEVLTCTEGFRDRADYSVLQSFVQNISEGNGICEVKTFGNDFDLISETLTSQNINVDARYRWSIISEGDISIDWESQAFSDSYSKERNNRIITYNAQYENDLDLVLEQGMSERDYPRVSIEDLLEEFVPDSEYGIDKDDIGMTNFEDSLDNSSITDIDDIDEGMMQESLDAGYASLTRDSTLSTDEEERKDSRSTDSPLKDLTTPEEQETMEKVNCTIETTPSGRSLPEVKQSLEEKINQLKLEKMVVENKIREAKEEERARIEQQRRLQGKYPAERKLSLFKTLINLKQRLENQTLRIQRSYSAVLTMQKNFSRPKPTFLCVPTHITM